MGVCYNYLVVFIEEGYKEKMKKRFPLILAVLAFALVFPGCSGEKNYDITTMNMDKYMTLGEYKGITVDYTPKTADDEAIQEQIKSMMISNSEKIAIKEGTAKKGDLVNINYVGYKDDVPFDGGTANSQNVLIGAGNYIPGFEEAIIGLKPGETVDAKMTFPEEYHNADLAGQDVVFAITLNFIYPEITDEVVAQMENSKYTTKEEFENYAREVVEKDLEESNSTAVTTLAFEKILENSMFKEIPDVVKENQKADLEKKYAVAIEGGAGGLDSVIQYLYGCSAEELIEVYSKQRMAIQAIAKKEGITVTDEEVEARLTEVGAMYGMDGENYLKVNDISREKFKELMISEKVKTFIYENTNTPGAAEE